MCVLHQHLLRRPMTDGLNSMFLLSHHQLRTSSARRTGWRSKTVFSSLANVFVRLHDCDRWTDRQTDKSRGH